MRDAATCAELRSIGTNKLDSVSECGMTLLVGILTDKRFYYNKISLFLSVRPQAQRSDGQVSLSLLARYF
jgi:hypothetical protein